MSFAAMGVTTGSCAAAMLLTAAKANSTAIARAIVE
jgi:hypothetical protein